MVERIPWRRLNVLLVDDCVAERDLYKCVLEPEFHILTASRGEEGVALAAEHHPDVISAFRIGVVGEEAVRRSLVLCSWFLVRTWSLGPCLVLGSWSTPASAPGTRDEGRTRNQGLGTEDAATPN
jgi:hypothetical protein